LSLKVKNNFNLVALSVASGVLLWLGWPPFSNSLLLFVALVPLLIIENSIENSPKGRLKLFFLLYLSFLIWNLLTTYWIYHASAVGAALAIILNALFMCIPFMLFNRTKKITDIRIRYASLVFFWISFEYIHMNWDASWPWLTLGNGFASNVKLVQWYELTGVLGGSVWIWMVNISIYKLFKTADKGIGIYKIIRATLIFLTPIALSLYMYSNYTETGEEVAVTIIQPNIDPYNEKFGSLTPEEQVEKMLSLAEQNVDSTTGYLVFPETAIAYNIKETELNDDPSVQMMKDFMQKHPGLKIVTGAGTYSVFNEGEDRPITARKRNNIPGYIDHYNTALYIDTTDIIGVYHKSKLVPGVEKMPFPRLLGFLENYAIQLGGTSGSFGQQKHRSVFVDSGLAGIAPVICYESIYGDFVSSYFNVPNKKANVIFIITNDGWWGNTEGYKQHLLYGRLRAIENRKHIVRSANTGISCIIDQRGDIHSATGWWVPAAVKEKVKLNTTRTYYMMNGDYIGFFAIWFSAFYILLILSKVVINKRQNRLRVEDDEDDED
jgi:apolipoprotein N-acyltransferase